MRQGQNKRMRGRNGNSNGSSNNRKGPNPLTRTYETNGPDVKFRGTAQHVAEKYLQLARDAHASGDPVKAESYLQHAEHYFRLIAAAHLAQQQVLTGSSRNEEEFSEDEDEFGGMPDRFVPYEKISNNGASSERAAEEVNVEFRGFEPKLPEKPISDNRGEFRQQDRRGEYRERNWQERNGEGRSDYRNDSRAPEFRNRGERNFGERSAYSERPSYNNDRSFGERHGGERAPNTNNTSGGERGSENWNSGEPRHDRYSERGFNDRAFDDRNGRTRQRDGRRRDFRKDRLDGAAESGQAQNVEQAPLNAAARHDFTTNAGLPAFISTPTRIAISEPGPEEVSELALDHHPLHDSEATEQPAKSRRKRRTKAEIEADNARLEAARLSHK